MLELDGSNWPNPTEESHPIMGHIIGCPNVISIMLLARRRAWSMQALALYRIASPARHAVRSIIASIFLAGRTFASKQNRPSVQAPSPSKSVLGFQSKPNLFEVFVFAFYINAIPCEQSRKPNEETSPDYHFTKYASEEESKFLICSSLVESFAT